MRLLVTGVAGQVARSIAERAADDEIVFAHRPDFDLRDPASIERVVVESTPDVIVSAAAYTEVDRAEDEPDIARAVNGVAPGTLARAAAKADIPIIHISTDYVFDGSLGRPWREDDLVSPLGVYGATKLIGEDAVAGTDAPYVILRTAWVYSAFGKNFVKTMLHLAQDRDEIRVVADQIGCPTSALDVADSILTIAHSWDRKNANQIYHMAGTGEASWSEFARAIFAASEQLGGPTARVVDIPTAEYPTRAVRPMNSRLDTDKLFQHFGYRAPHWRGSLAEAVARLV